MPALTHQETLSTFLTNRGLHAKALLEANEERINALHNTLKLLEQERDTLCGKLQEPASLTAKELSWVFRPAAPLMVNHGVSDHHAGLAGNYC